MKNIIKQIISDSAGQASSVRIITITMTMVVLFTWSVISLRSNQLQHLDVEAIMLLLGGVSATVTQKGLELSKGGRNNE